MVLGLREQGSGQEAKSKGKRPNLVIPRIGAVGWFGGGGLGGRVLGLGAYNTFSFSINSNGNMEKGTIRA